jgi:50S ribosomal subunit-associated GTPase HflX
MTDATIAAIGRNLAEVVSKFAYGRDPETSKIVRQLHTELCRAVREELALKLDGAPLFRAMGDAQNRQAADVGATEQVHDLQQRLDRLERAFKESMTTRRHRRQKNSAGHKP